MGYSEVEDIQKMRELRLPTQSQIPLPTMRRMQTPTSEKVQTTLKEHSWLEFEFNIAVQNVRAILSEHPAARDNDNLLIALYWKNIDGLEVPVDLISKATSAEHIRRARQHLQNKLGELGPSLKVRAARSRAERGFRAKFGKKKPQDTTLDAVN